MNALPPAEETRDPRHAHLEAAQLELLRRRAARQHLLPFMLYCWWHTNPMIVGWHTKKICERITRAVMDFRKGISSNIVIEMPPRHQKSDIVSRALPAFFLGACADLQPDVIMSGYGAELVESFSRKARKIVESPQYTKLFPGVRLSREKNAQNQWGVEDSAGEVTAVGLGGSVTGRGAHLQTLDDYCKSRQEAESRAHRDHAWDAFTNDFLTRRAPVSISIIAATRWHVDDVVGRIRKAMKEDDDFPRFEFLSFPARKPAAGDDPGYDYLFPERFGTAWYDQQRASLGKYSAASLFDLNPQVRGGNMFEVDRIKYHDATDVPKDLRQVRAWDPASSKKQRDSDDPDYTAGPRLGLVYEGPIPHLWVSDCVAIREEAPKRNRRIYLTAIQDGQAVPIVTHKIGHDKDTHTTIKEALRGQYSVKQVSMAGDKVVRAQPLEPIFEAGNVHLVRGEWNDLFVEQFTAFPATGTHDDIVDAVAVAYEHLRRPDMPGGMNLTDIGVKYPKP